MNVKIFEKLSKLFKTNGFRLYIIGGTSRDYLLNKDIFDYDFVTDATPDEMRIFLPDANYHFAKFGTIKIKIDGVYADITTLREEAEYLDFRHPNKLSFVKEIEKDYVRRDFTINAIYIDENYNFIDPSNGLIDLKNKIIRFIGEPEKRVQEDPIRILRAERFAKKLNFVIEQKSLEAIKKYRYLLDNINSNKLKEEKMKLNKIQ